MKTLFNLSQIVVLIFTIRSTCYGKSFLATYASNACSSDQVQTEPLNQFKSFTTPNWQDYFNNSALTSFFLPEAVDKEYKASYITRDDVSSSHLLNLVAGNIRAIEQKYRQRLKEKHITPIVEGKSYSEEEYNSSIGALDTLRKTEIDPMLKELYAVYLDGLRKKNEKKVKAQPQSEAYIKFLAKAREQRAAISNAIDRIQPSLKEKLGDILPVVDNNLPLSYKDGYVVEIRFQKPGESDHITIYPTLIYNQLIGDDDAFLSALARWKEYTEWQYKNLMSLLNAANETGVTSYIHLGWELAIQFYNNTFGPQPMDPFELVVNADLISEAFTKAKKDFERAKWVHHKIATLSNRELYGLLDLFRALRYGDIVKCQNQVASLQKNWSKLLGGEKSSSSAKFTKEQKNYIDKMASEVVFYQDQYQVFSNAAALSLSYSHSGRGRR